MRSKVFTFQTLAASTLIAAASLWALAAPEAKVTREQATRTALAAVPGGKVKSTELETEGGKLVWSFDIVRAGVDGATEIQVDAISGAIVVNKAESAAEEAKEAQLEKAEKAGKAGKR
jgi:uncharacterized membrane protein YkoI